MGKLNTGWRHWDKHLSRFADLDEPIHAMEIGSYEGDATVWFLRNLCTFHKDSTMTCLDTWEGSPEYVDVNFSEVEKKFDANIAKTNQADKVRKIKGLSHPSLIQLLARPTRPEFHVIFIDASHEARDVLADAVLSWPMLKRGGVMIFDDYKWQKLSPEYFRPKPAIDSFILCMKPELNVLDIVYQALVEKRIEFEKPIRTLENHRPRGGETTRRKSRGRNTKQTHTKETLKLTRSKSSGKK